MPLIELTSAQPTRKRKRESPDPHAVTDLSPARSSRFWFDDGNIVFRAQNTDFRVYKGIITRNSKFFHQRLSLPRPEGEPLLEGCPIVYVDDTAKDWEHVFGILYDSDVTYKSTAALALPLLSSMLRLGRKYEIEKVYDSALERIKLDLPETLSQWDETFSTGGKNASRLDGMEVELLDILLDTGIKSLLPLAYFRCVGLSVGRIFRPIVRHDEDPTRLPLDAIEKLLSGRERLRFAMLEYRFGWVKNYPGSPRTSCMNPVQCNGSTIHAVKALPNMSPASVFLLHEDFFARGFCRHCFVEIKAASDVGRQKIWDELPTYFGLPAWKDLR